MRFVAISMGSMAELKTHLVIVLELGYVKKEKLIEVEEECEIISKQLYALYNALDRKK